MFMHRSSLKKPRKQNKQKIFLNVVKTRNLIIIPFEILEGKFHVFVDHIRRNGLQFISSAIEGLK